MPVRRSAWSAWNFLAESSRDGQTDEDGVTLTYWMNLLQSLSQEKYGPIFVTLNAPPNSMSPEKQVAEFAYEHPIYTANSVASQKKLAALQGWKGARFAGAWTNYGFHEDGFASGLRAAVAMGAALPFEVQSAERSLPPSSTLSQYTLSALEAIRRQLALLLAPILAPFVIALSLALEVIVNAIVFAIRGRGQRCAVRNEIRSVRLSWERQLPIRWQMPLEQSGEAKNK